MDLKGAYNLLTFRLKDVLLLGFEMTDDLLMFCFCGQFGWTGTPAYFQSVTRAILHELSKRLRGRARMYVDDIFGVCRKSDLPHELATAQEICESILGPDAVEHTKTESGLRLAAIGYDIDIAHLLVSIARKNVLKAVHGFLSTDVNAPITVKTLQRLASWGSRYGEICRYMQPFVGALYSAYTGKSTQGSFELPKAARISILLFQVLLSLSSLFEVEFTRDLGSFQRSQPLVIVEFDASLSGVGIIWYRRELGAVTEVLLGACSLDITSLGFGTDSSLQNTAEFIAGALGVRGLSAFGISNCAIEMRGDSVSALQWAKKSKVKSATASNASVFFALQNMALRIQIEEVTHLSSEQNWRCDMLSRGKVPADLGILDDRFLDPNIPIVNLTADRVLQLCDPTFDATGSENSFIQFWSEIQSLVLDRITHSQ